MASSEQSALKPSVNFGVLDDAARQHWLYGSPTNSPVTSKPRLLGLWFSQPIVSFRNAVETVGHYLRLEREMGAGFLWSAVAFGFGATSYFALPREPGTWAFPVAVLICLFLKALLTKLGASHKLRATLVAVALMASGAAVAKFHTESTNAHLLPYQMTTKLTGTILSREIRANLSVRYLIEVHSIERLSDGVLPQRVRITARAKNDMGNVGDKISGLARIQPPSGPAYPGGYDFAFSAYYSGLSGYGFFLGTPKFQTQNLTVTPLATKFTISISTIRANIGQRIRAALPGEAGALAAALIVGDRSGISENTSLALRNSGLAHILAISGLHMALVTATVMMMVRMMFSAIPGLTLNYPVKKWAAGFALVAATLYLTISGASVATQRAYIMIAIVLTALLLDRQALTIRNVALAVFIVLVLRPHSIVTPSFQMSFAAVAALVAIYAMLANHRKSKARKQFQQRTISRTILIWVAGLALTSLVAGLATGIFAAYHFHRVAPLSLVANLLAMPIVSLLVMPMALISMLAMPFGLEIYPLHWLGVGVDLVVSSATWVSGDGSHGAIGTISRTSLMVCSAALIIFCFLKTRLRYAALLLIPFAFWLAKPDRLPDILISEGGLAVGVITDASGARTLDLMNTRKDKFQTEIWERAYLASIISDETSANDDTETGIQKTNFQCDRQGCAYREKLELSHQRAERRGKALLTASNQPGTLLEDCARSKIIVAKYSIEKIPRLCERRGVIVIDRQQLRDKGAHAIYLNADSEHTITTAYGAYKRPWNHNRSN